MITKLLLSLMLSLAIVVEIAAQTPVWKKLESIPDEQRYNDIFFVTPQLGWTIHPFVGTLDSTWYIGRIYKTTDGGETWKIQLDSSRNHFRCMGFADSLHGWVFSIGGSDYAAKNNLDTTLVYQTTDGGTTWTTPESVIEGAKPPGLCGISVVNSNVVYASGRVGGPAFMLKTTNQGKSWKSIDMHQYAADLIDCYFWSEDSGIVVGGTNTVDSLSSGLILFTSDGGNSWTERHRTDSTGELCWKISFPSKNVGYVTGQRIGKASSLLKTTDQGVTWKRIWLPSNASFLQGVGFLNDTLGWTGGWHNLAFLTKNGGKTWSSPYIGSDVGLNVNRFRFFGDSLGYCSGKGIYKMVVEQLHVEEETTTPFNIMNFPNPFQRSTLINFTLTRAEHVTLKIYNMLGHELITLINQPMTIGDHSVSFTPDYNTSQSYYYILHYGTSEISRHMLQLR